MTAEKKQLFLEIMKKVLLILSVMFLAFFTVLFSGANSTNAHGREDKVNICHATGSESNPWKAIRVNESAFDGEGQNDHTLHGDFLYEGPVDPENQQPTDDSWCEEDEEPEVCDDGSAINYGKEEECEYEEEPTPTPTDTEEEPTLTNTPTPTPTTKPGNGGSGGPGDGLSDGRSDGRSDGLSDGRGGAVLGATTAAKRGEVLGASTMAATGSFPTSLASMEQVFGIALMALGAGLHGKKKFFKKTK
jgi:hypothetical protein